MRWPSWRLCRTEDEVDPGPAKEADGGGIGDVEDVAKGIEAVHGEQAGLHYEQDLDDMVVAAQFQALPPHVDAPGDRQQIDHLWTAQWVKQDLCIGRSPVCAPVGFFFIK